MCSFFVENKLKTQRNGEIKNLLPILSIPFSCFSNKHTRQICQFKVIYCQITFSDSFDMYERPKSYLKSHLVGHHLPAATMTRPYTSASMTSRPHSVASFTRPYSTSFSPIHSEYALDREEFIRSPSIPACHMPYEALKQQVKRGWDTAHYVREMSVPTGRDSIKYSQWNDISA